MARHWCKYLSLMLWRSSIRLGLIKTYVYRSRARLLSYSYIHKTKIWSQNNSWTLCLKPQLTLTTVAAIAVWILAAVFCSLYLYPKANIEIQHGPKNKEVHVVASSNKIMEAITLNYLTHNYQVKHWLISMPLLFPWSTIAYKFLNQNVWICYSPSPASVVLWADSEHSQHAAK